MISMDIFKKRYGDRINQHLNTNTLEVSNNRDYCTSILIYCFRKKAKFFSLLKFLIFISLKTYLQLFSDLALFVNLIKFNFRLNSN